MNAGVLYAAMDCVALISLRVRRVMRLVMTVTPIMVMAAALIAPLKGAVMAFRTLASLVTTVIKLTPMRAVTVAV